MTNKLLWSPSNVNTNLTKFKKKYFNTPEDCTYAVSYTHLRAHET